MVEKAAPSHARIPGGEHGEPRYRRRRADASMQAMPTVVTRRAPETVIFAGATAVALLHALDDAFTGRQPGVGLGQHALAAFVAVLLGVGGVHLFPRLRGGGRAALAFVFGSLAFVNGVLHVKHIQLEGVAGSDLTGVLAAGAGVTLLALAAAIPWRHRGEGTWRRRTVAAPASLVLLAFVVMIGTAITETHKFREPVGPPPSAAYREIAFEARDGVKLSGWYRPTRNGATMIVLHGGGGTRNGALAHARMLARHGYGVLLYDARGRGRSEGVQNSFGWGWGKDVAGALAFLRARPEVDPARIGGLGLSTGADVLIEVAGEQRGLRAVVADGAAAGSFEDWRRLDGAAPLLPLLAAEFATVRITSGAHSGPPLEEMVKRGTAPLLLVSGGREQEYDFNVAYDRVAGDRARGALEPAPRRAHRGAAPGRSRVRAPCGRVPGRADALTRARHHPDRARRTRPARGHRHAPCHRTSWSSGATTSASRT